MVLRAPWNTEPFYKHIVCKELGLCAERKLAFASLLVVVAVARNKVVQWHNKIPPRAPHAYWCIRLGHVPYYAEQDFEEKYVPYPGANATSGTLWLACHLPAFESVVMQCNINANIASFVTVGSAYVNFIVEGSNGGAPITLGYWHEGNILQHVIK